MKKIRTILTNPLTWMIIFSLFVAIVLPLLARLIHVSTAVRVGSLFLAFNTVASLLIGMWTKKYRLGWYVMLIFPVIFAAMVFWRYARYDYWLVPIYFLLSLMSYELTERR